MRLAVQNPRFLFANQARNFDGYNFAFLRLFRPVILLTGWRARVTRGLRWRAGLRNAGLDPKDYQFVYSPQRLNGRADVLVCFNQAAVLPPNRPPTGFRGMKVWHVMDFNFRTSESYRALVSGGVDYLLAYTDLGRHCSFFQQYYPAYVSKVIPVPFGFGERFRNEMPFEQRIQKVVAMGAINPVDQDKPGADPVLKEYAEYYRSYPFSQMWRRTLVEKSESLSDILDSFLPLYPEISRPTDDPVVMLNRYALFANDESICNFPPARTYEGPAAGAVMVSSSAECFRELGFEDGVNCIMHRPMDIEDFREKVLSHLAVPDRLKHIAAAGCEMVRSRYTHASVAQRLYGELEMRWRSRSP